MGPLVSIITPAFNAERFIRDTIESVLRQTYRGWEMLIVDDGSRDGTVRTIGECTTDPRVRCIRRLHGERAAARNTGLSHARGEYVAFLDADDLWRPEKLSRQVEAMKRNSQVGLCFTGFVVCDELGVCRPVRLLWPANRVSLSGLLQQNFIVNSSVIIRRAVLSSIGAFDEALPCFGAEDWDMWIRIARRWSMLFLDEALTVYRRHPAGTSGEKLLESGQAVLRKFFDDAALPNCLVRRRGECEARLLLITSLAYVKANQRRRAFELWWRGILHYPWILKSPRPGIAATCALLLPRWLVKRANRWWA